MNSLSNSAVSIEIYERNLMNHNNWLKEISKTYQDLIQEIGEANIHRVWVSERRLPPLLARQQGTRTERLGDYSPLSITAGI